MSDRNMGSTAARLEASIIETNKVLRNTYMLLGMTLAFSALTAGVSMAINLPYSMGLVLSLSRVWPSVRCA